MRKEIIGNATLTTAIYALVEWGSEMPRYVGKTVQYLHERHKAHIRDAKRGGRRPVHYWLRKRIAEGRVAIKLLEYVPAGADWAARERYWINRFRAEGHDILNLTEGGEGLAGHSFSAEHRLKISAALKTGAEFNCEVCNTRFWRKRRDIRMGNCRFCSRECYAQSQAGVPKSVPRVCVERGVAAAAAAKRAMTHCKRGHALSGGNLFITSQGSRGCKECRKIHKRTYMEKARG